MSSRLNSRQQQMNLLYATLPVDQDSYPLELPRVLIEEDTADGLLLVGAFLDETLAQVVERHLSPIVLVDAYSASNQYDAIVTVEAVDGYWKITGLELLEEKRLDPGQSSAAQAGDAT